MSQASASVPVITLSLPDGSTRSYTKGITGDEIALQIGAGLHKAALAIEVDGELLDLSRAITHDAHIRIITGKDKEGLEIIRHDASHIMAEAVKELYPNTQVTIGPATAEGFYYDFDRDEPFTPECLEKIEAKMREIVARNENFVREVWDRDKAVAHFKSIGEHYKAEIIASIPSGEEVSIYRQGNFLDLCRGPHAPSTGKIRAFKLMKLAGAYWRGDSKNKMLQRIYGTAWADEKQLAEYLHRLEEAEKRDHRKLGREMNLFHLQEEAAGQVFWHPKGWTIVRTLEQFIRQKLQKNGYVEVKTPMLLDSSFWEASGHWDKFRENMFSMESEEKTIAIKPMNCPCHVQIFKSGLKSYRDLPLRMAEFGTCHRNEPSGALHGLMRVRAMTQDDAHIFCTEDQILPETRGFCDLLREVYTQLGFNKVEVKIATRPEKRAGTDATWDKAEQALVHAVEAVGLPFEMAPGEGAFYGPKLEFHLEDAIGRSWQCGTLQLDFVLPERLDATYIGSDGNKHRPVMLHRAILGSIERFVGIMIEDYAGKFPFWLAPVQAVVATVTNEVDDYAKTVASALAEAGVRVETDLGSDKISYKVREHSLQKVPVILAVGKKEAEQNTVSVRRLGSEAQETLALSLLVDKLCLEAKLPGSLNN